MKKIFVIILILGLLPKILLAGPREEAQLQLKLTKDYISDIKPVVSRINCRKALELLYSSENLLMLAYYRFTQGKYLEALNFAKEALTKAKLSFSISKIYIRARVNLIILGSIFERLKSLEIPEGLNRELLRRALWLYGDARGLFKEEKYLASLRKSTAALDIVKSVFRGGKEDPKILKSRLQNEFEVVRNLYRMSRDRLSPEKSAQVEALLKTVSNLEQEEKYRLALFVLERVKRILKESIKR